MILLRSSFPEGSTKRLFARRSQKGGKEGPRMHKGMPSYGGCNLGLPSDRFPKWQEKDVTGAFFLAANNTFLPCKRLSALRICERTRSSVERVYSGGNFSPKYCRIGIPGKNVRQEFTTNFREIPSKFGPDMMVAAFL